MTREEVVQYLKSIPIKGELSVMQCQSIVEAVRCISGQRELSRRDEIASRMMAAWRSNPESYHVSKEEVAKYAINDADVLIAELDKEANND